MQLNFNIQELEDIKDALSHHATSMNIASDIDPNSESTIYHDARIDRLDDLIERVDLAIDRERDYITDIDIPE